MPTSTCTPRTGRRPCSTSADRLVNTDTWPAGLRRRFEAIAFDWDGTAVTDRHADATPVREQIEALVRLGVDVGVIRGTHVENIDSQLHARPTGPGRLHLCVNRGSEVYEVNQTGPHLLYRRAASPEEEAAPSAVVVACKQPV